MQEIKLPNLGEGITHGDVVRVLVTRGDAVRLQQTVIELETDKALIEVPCELEGTISEVLVSEGERVEVGQVILTVDAAVSGEAAAVQESSEPSPQAALDENQPTVKPPKPPTDGRLPRPEGADFDPEAVVPAAGPTTRRLARDLGVDIAQVTGSGSDGRVTRDDVRGHVRRRMQDEGPVTASTPAIELPDFRQWGEVESKPLSNLRKTAAEHLGRSWLTVPQVTQQDDADITELEEMRGRFKPEAREQGVNLTLTILLLKSLVAALKAYPRFNSSIDLAGKQLILKHYYHIGIAVDTPRGLLVPVLRDVDRKSVWQLSAEMTDLVGRARSGKVELSELRGASFSLSNQGGIGGTHFTPLVNSPEAAILGVGEARIQPVWSKELEQFRPRLKMPLALSYDHRIVDGADAARFITQLKHSLEDPHRLLLDL